MKWREVKKSFDAQHPEPQNQPTQAERNEWGAEPRYSTLLPPPGLMSNAPTPMFLHYDCELPTGASVKWLWPLTPWSTRFKALYTLFPLPHQFWTDHWDLLKGWKRLQWPEASLSTTAEACTNQCKYISSTSLTLRLCIRWEMSFIHLLLKKKKKHYETEVLFAVRIFSL